MGKGFGAVGTVWVRVAVPELTDKAAVSSAVAGENGGGTEGLVTILSYITWVSGVLAVGALMVLAVLFAVKRDQGLAITDRIVMVLAGVIVLSGGTSIVAALLPNGPQGVGGTVHFLQASTWWYTVAGALLGVLIGGAKMIAQQRATAGKELVQSLVTLILVAAGGVTVVNLLITAADSYSIWILNKSLTCELDTTGNCFGAAMTAMIVFVGVTNIATGGFGSILIIILGIIALLIVLVQIVLMIARGAILVVLCGTLTLSASATNTQRGGAWFQKVIGWILAFILYKPAAATIYASAFRLTGTDPSESGNAIITAMSGIMLLVLALIALPALMRTIVPAVGAVASSAGGGAAGAALGAAAMSNPSGAIDVAKRGLGMLGGKTSGGDGASGSSDTGGSDTGGSGSGGDAKNVGADTTGAAAPVAASTAGTAATPPGGGPRPPGGAPRPPRGGAGKGAG
ncbi:MAG: hypothetical protein L0H79_07000, partial [Intrasporangium sp.]|uniref:hypothetical protein n=1 Tax=Intrasporangium sp. TaxID=1925024 RepID=UPI0026496FE6